jgi:hypothetical protein
MKLVFENWRKYLTEDWQDTYWKTDDGKKITIGDVVDYLDNQKIAKVPVVPSEIRDQVLKSRNKDRLPVGPGITSQKRVDDADLNFPIIITKKDGKFIEVLDGNHRLQKAFEQGEPLKARVLDLDNPETPEVFKRMFG